MTENRFRSVAVLGGGPSAEREISLRSAEAVSGALRTAGYRVTEVDPSRNRLGVPEGTDAVFIALHGEFGEDGTVQTLLRDLGIPYTGPGPEASHIAFDKVETKKHIARRGVHTPAFEVVRHGDPLSLPFPVMVKPVRQGSSLGLHRVDSDADWLRATEDAGAYDEEILVEAFIDGRELTVGIVGEQVLPIVEIRPASGCYDYDAKYTYAGGETEYLIPAPLDEAVTQACSEAARNTFHALGCTGFSRIDIRLSTGHVPHVLEINTIPGFTATSLLPKAAAAAGIDFPSLCRRILESASVH